MPYYNHLAAVLSSTKNSITIPFGLFWSFCKNNKAADCSTAPTLVRADTYQGGEEEATPSVEVAAKIAEALDVSLDYLVGNANIVIKDKTMLYRLELLEKIAPEDKDTILKVMDSLLKDAQLNHTHKKLK